MRRICDLRSGDFIFKIDLLTGITEKLVLSGDWCRIAEKYYPGYMRCDTRENKMIKIPYELFSESCIFDYTQGIIYFTIPASYQDILLEAINVIEKSDYKNKTIYLRSLDTLILRNL